MAHLASWPCAALGNLKTAFAGIYHAFGSAEYAARYLADAQVPHEPQQLLSVTAAL